MNATYGTTFGLNVQQYKGESYLTFWQGKNRRGIGTGYYYMVSAISFAASNLTRHSSILHTEKHTGCLQQTVYQETSTSSS